MLLQGACAVGMVDSLCVLHFGDVHHDHVQIVLGALKIISIGNWK